ncbi:hypothetical protein CONPUDRAFT_156967 [Coniophora puteana RWD-64-598 SS2]|uniref:Uncharacterized protein n=1 Tax=Coniophora puteana (strain RWD-64-598) TaxID=741705 RepID=A0A5M3MGP1_CONPW|nr:uncharacterized protein CONPUDRAFT_156967 [Coniophora puteana RWD-64-598 SS2]EIW77781.1 hypothetical protein CONPUDRAFT_156967 [Coniophora puteana RWD-64-598 SS2]
MLVVEQALFTQLMRQPGLVDGVKDARKRKLISKCLPNVLQQAPELAARRGLENETGKSVPTWALKVEGLLEIPDQRPQDKVHPRKFSKFIKCLIVELDRDPNVYADGNIVEVRRPALATFAEGGG